MINDRRDPNPTAETLRDPAAAATRAAPADIPERIGEFRILGLLGRGGMGVVYRAEDEALRRIVALKMLSTTGSDEARRRFLREARSGAAISHPNVAVVHQVGEAGGHIYIAMELIEGESLRERLMRQPLDLASARELALQVARGLGAAHDRGIVHRDLKPENVMITRDGVVKLLDFGLAKAASQHDLAVTPESAESDTAHSLTTQQGRIMGTPAYMSPEQAFGDPLDARSDVFSFGIMFYEMLAQTRPFSAASSTALLMAITRDPVPPLRSRASGVDEATESIVMTCLAKAPEGRFASAKEVASALAGQTPQQTNSAARSAHTLVAKTSARARLPARRVAAVAVALAVAGAGATWGVRRVIHTNSLSRSSNADAQRLFAQAMRSFREGTGQEQALLERAVQLDPGFGGARVRLLASTLMSHGYSEHEHDQREIDARRREALELETVLSKRDRALLDGLAGDDAARMTARLDAYLKLYPDDDMAWALVAERGELGRALVARPALPQLLATQAADHHTLERAQDDAIQILDRCLTQTPHAIDCLHERAQILASEGLCAKAEQDVRLWLDLEPSARGAHTMLAALVAGRGGGASSVREALGDSVPSLNSVWALPETLLPMFDGDLAGVTQIAAERASHVSAGAGEFDHLMPAYAQIQAYTEEGDLVSAGRIALDFLQRRAAWKATCAECEATAVGAAARAGLLDAKVAAERLEADYQAVIKDGESPQVAWASTYAVATETRNEARSSVAQLERLGLEAPARSWAAPVGRTLFLADRGEQARPPLEHIANHCVDELELTVRWVQAHLYLGELDERRGDRVSACAHYGKVIQRWSLAKPQSVTASEARLRANALACPP